jgi:nucleotide-binding universal stress UspA family protein
VYTKIIAGTDLSDTAKIATDRAAMLASKLGAELILIHAGSDPGKPLKELGQEYAATAEAVPGPPADVLLAEAEKRGADLLVVGSVGMTGARRFLLGSVPNKVSHHAGTDLMIVKTNPPKSTGEYKKMLVGTDGSPTAMRALDVACDFGAKLGNQVACVCAYQPPTERELEHFRSDPSDPIAQWSAGNLEKGTPEEFRWRIAGAAQAEDILERAAEHADQRGVQAEAHAIKGNAAEVLITFAEKEDVDLIAVGSVGMTGPKRFMLGNVPNRVSHHAPTDVLIIHTA